MLQTDFKRLIGITIHTLKFSYNFTRHFYKKTKKWLKTMQAPYSVLQQRKSKLWLDQSSELTQRSFIQPKLLKRWVIVDIVVRSAIITIGAKVRRL